MQAEWSCPRAGYPMPKSPAALPGACVEALGEIQMLTGAEGFCTCPRAYLSLPWVVRAARARSYRESGSLPVIEPYPPAALIEAMSVIDSAYGERLRTERKQSEAAREAPAPSRENGW